MSAIEQCFNEFWEAYPKKIAKQTAFNAWKKAKPTAELHAKILTAIEAAKRSDKWRKDNGQFIPNPATWINGGCWDDVITLPPVSGVRDTPPTPPQTFKPSTGGRTFDDYRNNSETI